MTDAVIRLFGRPVGRIHCVGVGGMGVGPLAIYLAGRGLSVSGEDDAMTEAMRLQLVRAGVSVGPMPAGCDLLACSSAIRPDHPAAVAARAAAIPIVRRGELLAEVAKGLRLVAVCGSHGKTTTTAMLAHALRRSGFGAGYIVGGLFADEALPPAAAGSNDWLVAEIDESDGTIERFSPEITVATNLDWDHPDHYRTPEALERTFGDLFRRTRGMVLVNEACAASGRLTAGLPGAARFGGEGEYSYHLDAQDEAGLRLRFGGRYRVSGARVRARGAFNAANAAAALAAAEGMGAVVSEDALADYPPVRRRQSVLHAGPDFVVIEDYAHHPAEIAALLGSLRAQLPPGARLVAAFQPHRYSRTAQFRDAFVGALAAADSLHLLDVYPAGEDPVEGGRSTDLAEACRASGRAEVYHHGSDGAACFSAIEASLRPGDHVAVVGAGDIDQMARAWLGKRTWDARASSLKASLSPDTRITREEPLGPKTTLRAGGAARLFAEPASVEDLRQLVLFAGRERVPCLCLGRGSNLVVPDEGVDGLVLSFAHPSWSRFEMQPDGRIWVGAGLRLKALCGQAAKAGLAGFEFLEGIPGSVGGALRMNAGAMGGWMFDIVAEVLLMTPEGRVETVSRDKLTVDYRSCRELITSVALGALINPVSKSESEAIARKIEAYRLRRQASQPREPSAGCAFKNPPGDFAGRLIEACGLKGRRVGDAEVSEVHANFIINRGAASAADVIALMRLVRSEVRAQTGFLLEPEVLLFGGDWSRVL